MSEKIDCKETLASMMHYVKGVNIYEDDHFVNVERHIHSCTSCGANYQLALKFKEEDADLYELECVNVKRILEEIKQDVYLCQDLELWSLVPAHYVSVLKQDITGGELADVLYGIFDSIEKKNSNFPDLPSSLLDFKEKEIPTDQAILLMYAVSQGYFHLYTDDCEILDLTNKDIHVDLCLESDLILTEKAQVNLIQWQEKVKSDFGFDMDAIIALAKMENHSSLD